MLQETLQEDIPNDGLINKVGRYIDKGSIEGRDEGFQEYFRVDGHERKHLEDEQFDMLSLGPKSICDF